MRTCITLAAALTLAAGCGDPSSGIVTGTVTFDGTPVKSGMIQFVPTDGKSPTAGGIITDGQFTVTVPVGTKTVVLSGVKVVGKKKVYDTPDSPVMDVTTELLPARYNTKSELTLEVKPGRQTVRYDTNP
jgi:hypothetical protein